ncbi:hypothetical protein AAC387_Pa08g1485 [Persea americana]
MRFSHLQTFVSLSSPIAQNTDRPPQQRHCFLEPPQATVDRWKLIANSKLDSPSHAHLSNNFDALIAKCNESPGSQDQHRPEIWVFQGRLVDLRLLLWLGILRCRRTAVAIGQGLDAGKRRRSGSFG